MKKLILSNVAVLVAGLVLCELVFGTWFTDTAALYHFTKPRNVSLRYKSFLPGQPEYITYTRDQYGFRGLDTDVGGIFMLTVGGSTTDQRFIDDGLTFQARLQELWAKSGRSVDVVNAGIDGQTTYGHIENFKYWFRHIPRLRPRYILFYVGINDFYEDARRDRFDDIRDSEGFFRWLKEKSAFHAAYQVIKSVLRPPRVAHSPRIRPWSTAHFTDKALHSDYRTPEVEASLSALRARIGKLAALTRQIGAEAIFVTQRTTKWVRQDGRIIGVPAKGPGGQNRALKGFGSLTGVDFYHLERMQAEAILEACRRSRSRCVDLAGEIEIDPATDFYDSAHTTPAGSARIAEYLFRKLRDLP